MRLQRRSSVTFVAGMPSATPARCSRLVRCCSSPPRRTISDWMLGEPGQDGLGVAFANGTALREHELEQLTGGVDLLVQVDEQLGLEDRAHDCISL